MSFYLMVTELCPDLGSIVSVTALFDIDSFGFLKLRLSSETVFDSSLFVCLLLVDS